MDIPTPSSPIVPANGETTNKNDTGMPSDDNSRRIQDKASSSDDEEEQIFVDESDNEEFYGTEENDSDLDTDSNLEQYEDLEDLY